MNDIRNPNNLDNEVDSEYSETTLEKDESSESELKNKSLNKVYNRKWLKYNTYSCRHDSFFYYMLL